MNKYTLNTILNTDLTYKEKVDIIEKLTTHRVNKHFKKVKATDIKYVIENIEAGKTFQEVANKFDVSRERIRQIYKRETGLSKKDVENIRHTKNCMYCGREFISKLKTAKYCSAECRAAVNYYENFRLHQCKFCTLYFIKRKNDIGIFCSKYCQGKYIGKNYGFGTKYNSWWGVKNK